MANKSHLLRHQIHVAPGEAAATILEAIRESGARMGAAAGEIGCTHGTLLRWIKMLGITAVVDEMVHEAKIKFWEERKRSPATGIGRPRKPYEVVADTGRLIRAFDTLKDAREHVKAHPGRGWTARKRAEAETAATA